MTVQSLPIDALVASARDGDRDALDQLVRAIQDDVYNLAVRMLWAPEDARDATQEILVKVVTHLATFRGDSAFRTWVYRVAANHLLNVRQSRVERNELSFDAFGDALEKGLAMPAAPAADLPDQPLLLEELKIGCTQAMLLCVPRDQRIAFILAEVFRLPGDEAAAVLEITPPAFRKRASRAREALRAFMHRHCGHVSDDAPCRCDRWLAPALASGIVNPDALQFAGRGTAQPIAADHVGEWDELGRLAAVYQGHPRYPAPESTAAALRDLIGSGRFALLN